MDSIDKIKLLLAEKGISGAALTRGIGVSSSMYSQWKQKTSKPTNETLKKIADFLGVSVREIMADNDLPQAPEKEIPHKALREVFAEGGVHVLLDADNKMPANHLLDIIDFIKSKQQENDRS